MGGKWGAIGISRRDCLMQKNINFDSLADLIQEFESSYVSDFAMHTFITPSMVSVLIYSAAGN